VARACTHKIAIARPIASRCPLFPNSRRNHCAAANDAMCQSRPSAPQQTTALLDHFGRWQAALIGSSDRIDFAIWRLMTNSNLNVLRASRFFALFQRRRKKSTRASKNATIRKPAISFVARPLISGVLNGRGGHPSVTPTSFCRVARPTVASCHAALHAASHGRLGELRAASRAGPDEPCAALAAAPSQPSRRQPVTASELELQSFATIQLREEPRSRTRHQR
jgi:hypothetical protein